MLKTNEEMINDSKFLSRFLTIAPFFCALMVIGIHCYNAGNRDQYGLTARIEGSLSHGLFTAAVPIFMFLSGYLFYRNADTLSDIVSKQKRRIHSDLIPFLGWSGFYYTLYSVAYAIVPSNRTVVNISIGAIIKGIVFYKHIFPMWFMFQLLIFIALAPILFKILENTKVSLFILCIAVVLAYFMINWTIVVDNDSRTIFAFNFFSYYFAGAIASKHQLQFIRIIEHLSRINWIAISAILVLTSILAGLAFDVLPVYNHRIMVPAVALFTFVLLYKFSKCEIFAGGGWSTDIRIIPTMTVYGLHPMIGLLIGKILGMIGVNGLMSFFIMFFCVSFVTCCGALIMKRIPILNLVFNGNRK